jgi:hypothetical protein
MLYAASSDRVGSFRRRTSSPRVRARPDSEDARSEVLGCCQETASSWEYTVSDPLSGPRVQGHLPVAGERVLLRERPWRVLKQEPLSPGRAVLELEALDGDSPRNSSILIPPDTVIPLPAEDLTLDPSAFDSFSSWSRGHRVLASSLVQETGLLCGARFGRVALEAYQLAPTLRVLAKPRHVSSSRTMSGSERRSRRVSRCWS